MSLSSSAGCLLNYRTGGASGIENVSIDGRGFLQRWLELRNRIGIVWRLRSGALCLLLLLLGRRRGSLLRRSLHASLSWSSSPTCVLEFFQRVAIDRGLPGLSHPILVRQDVCLGRRSRPLHIFGQSEES